MQRRVREVRRHVMGVKVDRVKRQARVGLVLIVQGQFYYHRLLVLTWTQAIHAGSGPNRTINIFPLFTSPHARKHGRAIYQEGAMPLRRARSSAQHTGGTQAGGGEAGMEMPTTEEVGREDLEVEESPEAG